LIDYDGDKMDKLIKLFLIIIVVITGNAYCYVNSDSFKEVKVTKIYYPNPLVYSGRIISWIKIETVDNNYQLENMYHICTEEAVSSIKKDKKYNIKYRIENIEGIIGVDGFKKIKAVKVIYEIDCLGKPD